MLKSIAADNEIELADGRSARLAFLDIPEGFADQARARVAALAGESVRLWPIGAAPDRWGRILAQIIPTKEGAGEAKGPSLGELLLRAGLARLKPEAMANSESLACFKALAASEAIARRDKAGLWADPRYALRDAADTESLLALTGSYAVFEGRVLSVGERRERTYLNFGRRWSEDTTVTIPKRLWAKMAGQGITAEALKGRRVRVRGIVESRDGPLVELASAEQLELVEAGQ